MVHIPEDRYDSEDNIKIVKQPVSPVDNVISCRYELKYRIYESKAEAIKQFIKPYVQLDRYCKLQRGGAYPIVSLYLDSDDLHLCRESLTGQKNRFKLRIRSYTDEPDYPRFFEIKRRINNVIVKNRARVMDNNVATLLAGLSLPPQDYDYTADQETLKQFQLYVNGINAKPVILIRYMRQAYEGDSENRVRITFDRHLAYNITNTPKVRLNSDGWHHRLFDGVILEIKFTNLYPAWLTRMVKYFDLRQQSMSKYATSVKEACSQAHFARRF